MTRVILFILKLFAIESILLSLILIPLGLYLSYFSFGGLLEAWWFWLFALPFYFLVFKFVLELWIVIIYISLKDLSRFSNMTEEKIINHRIIASSISLPLILVGVIFEHNGFINILNQFVYFSILYYIPVIITYSIIRTRITKQ